MRMHCLFIAIVSVLFVALPLDAAPPRALPAGALPNDVG